MTDPIPLSDVLATIPEDRRALIEAGAAEIIAEQRGMQATPEEEPAMTLNEFILGRLKATYVVRADARQKAMGLSYIEAETKGLADDLCKFVDQYIFATGGASIKQIRMLTNEITRLRTESDGEFVEAAVRVMKAYPGFNAQDYTHDGITADDFEAMFSEDMAEAWSQVERLKEENAELKKQLSEKLPERAFPISPVEMQFLWRATSPITSGEMAWLLEIPPSLSAEVAKTLHSFEIIDWNSVDDKYQINDLGKSVLSVNQPPKLHGIRKIEAPVADGERSTATVGPAERMQSVIAVAREVGEERKGYPIPPEAVGEIMADGARIAAEAYEANTAMVSILGRAPPDTDISAALHLEAVGLLVAFERTQKLLHDLKRGLLVSAGSEYPKLVEELLDPALAIIHASLQPRTVSTPA